MPVASDASPARDALAPAPVLGEATLEIEARFGLGEAPPPEVAAGRHHAFHTYFGEGLIVLAAYGAGHAYDLCVMRADRAAFTRAEVELWLARQPMALDGWSESTSAAGAARWTSPPTGAVIEWSADGTRLTAAVRRVIDSVPRGLSGWDRAGHFHLRVPWKAPRPEV